MSLLSLLWKWVSVVLVLAIYHLFPRDRPIHTDDYMMQLFTNQHNSPLYHPVRLDRQRLLSSSDSQMHTCHTFLDRHYNIKPWNYEVSWHLTPLTMVFIILMQIYNMYVYKYTYAGTCVLCYYAHKINILYVATAQCSILPEVYAPSKQSTLAEPLIQPFFTDDLSIRSRGVVQKSLINIKALGMVPNH